MRFDAAALWKNSPPIMTPREDGTVPPPPPAPRIFTISAEVPFADLLRVGSIDAVSSIEVAVEMTPRLDVSVPRIHGDTTRGYGLDGLTADIGIVDTGIDRTHPNLPYVTAQMNFTPAGMACDGGSNFNGACQSNCPGGMCATGTGLCVGGPAAGMTCCPGGMCETPVGDTGGHGTHVAGIAGNNSLGFRGMAHLADLINAKAIPGPNAPAALAFARGAGADVINGSYGATSNGCRGFCTAPPPALGALCTRNVNCNRPPGMNNGICGAPLGNPCIVNTDCDLPPGMGNGVCTSVPNTGQSGSTRAVDFEVFQSNITVAIAAEELPFNGRCSNAAATACWGDAACPAGGHCQAYPSDPNDTFNGITVGSTSVTPGASTVSFFSQRGPTSDLRSKPDVVAPGEAPPSGRCIGGGNNGNACSDVFGDADCPGGDCTRASCFGLCTAPAYLAGRLRCTANADCDSAVGTGDGACNLGANFGAACSDTRNSPECPGGRCSSVPDADGIDSCAADWEGMAVGRCSAPLVNRGAFCFVGADCDDAPGAGNGMCGTIPGRPAPTTPKPDFVDKEGTSMAAPHVTGLAAQLWDFANLRGLIKDTPHLKATILNTANRLAGWTRPSITQPLDIAQGTGEVDALEAFHAFADDLRVWQQRVTGTAPDRSHWYWTDLTAGAPVTLTLVFERHETNTAAAAVTPLNDLDLYLYDPSGTRVERSISLVDSVEHIVYTPTVTGRFCVEVDPFALPSGGAELYALAGTPERLNFTGTVNPCRPDFGDAPDPFTAPAFYPTLLASNGARHFDWTKEWLGTSRPEIDGELEKMTLAVRSRVDPFPSVSGETDAVDPADEDGMPNLVDRDGWDDGVVIPGPFRPGVPKIIKITVQTTVDDTGVGPTGRYDAAVPTKRLYLNGWADWDGNGDWGGAGEKIVGTGSPTGQVAVDPATFGLNGRFTIGETFTDANGSGRWEPNEAFIDTVGKTERTYSFLVVPPLVIAPDFYLRFRVDYGEDVGVVANVSGNLVQYRGQAGFGEVEDYDNRYEYDVFPHSVATVDVRFPADSTVEHLVTLSGPSTVCVDLASVSDTDGDGREQVPTQMVQLQLSGTDSSLGPIVVRRRDPSVHPFQASAGEIEESVNTVSGTLDLPPFVTSPPGLCADSFFNVFFEVELVDRGVTLHNHRPKRMSGMIYGKPPREGDTYSSPDFIPLYDQGENLVALIGPGYHTPNPRPRGGEVDIFPRTFARMDIRMPPGGDPNIVELSGPATVAVDLGGIADTDSDMLEQVSTEMTKLDLRGVAQPFGPLIVRTRSASLHPFQRSTGEIEENASLTAGVLDLPPFVNSPPGLDASSFFNIFLEVELPNLGVRLHNHAPKFMSSTIRRKPPAEGDVYENPDVIPLFDEAENLVAELGPGLHVPSPGRGTCCLSVGGSSCATGMSPAQCEGLGGRFAGDASCAVCRISTAPPGVPNTLHVQKLDPSGHNLFVFWSGSSCPAVDYSLLFGTDFPSTYFGTYSLAGGVCTTGGGEAMTWTPPPLTSRLLWFIVAAHDGQGTEGPWGRNTGGVDRAGSGPGGSSQVCSGDKSLVNQCGQSACTPNGTQCSLPASCCTVLCAAGLCCGPDGASCSFNGECCSGSCTSGVCDTPCRQIGQACALNSQCCSDNCGDGTCQAPCSPNGQACSSSGQCCSGSCLDGVCAAPCTSNGGSCSAPGECCSSVCLAGQCCGQDGATCSSSTECCGRSCVAGQCQSACLPPGQLCTTGLQCCSLSCPDGFCQSGCAGVGFVCGFPEQCCSRVCLDGRCQDACSVSGSTCSTDDQCCSGQCQEARCCEDVGHTCSLDAQCCSGACEQGACAASPECLLVGEQCSSQEECCSGNCRAGFCQPPCFPDGQLCGSPTECCSGFCPAGFCQTGCFPDGQSCVTFSQCCSLNCQGGFCQTGCFPDGQPCLDPSQCCSLNCQGGLCQPACLPDGQTCSFPSQCCSGNCQGGLCQPPCFPNGQNCSFPTQCCSGFCNAGTCGNPGCTPNGGACGSPAQCCSNNCLFNVCQPCVPNGGGCSNHNQCCSHFCNGNVCTPT